MVKKQVKKLVKKPVLQRSFATNVKKVLIMGAAGRDYHNFLVYFKDNPFYQVVGFTVNQIPGLDHRPFPQVLAGSLYHADIPVFPESRLSDLIKELRVDEVYLSYSDLSFQSVMEKASGVLAAGAKFCMLGTETMINTSVPVVAITAVRTGSGKSQTARRVALILKELGYRVVAIRHPMPYGNLLAEEVQRFAADSDLKKAHVTFEEREEYEPWVRLAIPVFAGVDYKKIVASAEREADIIVWDGGNNDFSFLRPDLHIVVADPLRPGHESSYYPGLVNVLTADVVVINKVDNASRAAVAHVIKNVRRFNKKAEIITAASPVTVANPALLAGKKVVVVEDGPSLTHGGLSHGAATVAAVRYKAHIVDARLFAKGSLVEVYKQFPHLGKELPAMGYGKQQVKDLQDTLNAAKADLILDGSPMNLSRVMKCNKPIIPVRYELQETGRLTLKKVLSKHFKGE